MDASLLGLALVRTCDDIELKLPTPLNADICADEWYFLGEMLAGLSIPLVEEETLPRPLQLLIQWLTELGMFADIEPAVKWLESQGRLLTQLSIRRRTTYPWNSAFPKALNLEILARMGTELKKVYDVGSQLLKERGKYDIPDTIPESWLVRLQIDPNWPGYLGKPGGWLEEVQTELDAFRDLATTLHAMQHSLQPSSRIIDSAGCLQGGCFMDLALVRKLFHKQIGPWLRDLLNDVQQVGGIDGSTRLSTHNPPSLAVLPYQSANIFLCPLAFIRCSTHHFFRYFPTCLNRRLPSTAGHVRGKKKQKQKRKNRVVQPFNRAARAACLSEIGSRVGNFRRI